jgi:RNA polymerase sigma-70 factor (ECF subfamily)
LIATIPKSPAQERAAPPDFESAVRQHQAMVFSLAFHFLRDRSVAEELAQEVFLELYTHLDDMQSPEHLRFWLRQVTVRRCIDQTRRGRFRRHISLSDIPEPFVWMPAGDPKLREHLRRLIAGLAEAPRAAMILRYQEDMSPTEIAELLDMPLATVKSHLQRSLALLRRKLGSIIGDVTL